MKQEQAPEVKIPMLTDESEMPSGDFKQHDGFAEQEINQANAQDDHCQYEAMPPPAAPRKAAKKAPLPRAKVFRV